MKACLTVSLVAFTIATSDAQQALNLSGVWVVAAQNGAERVMNITHTASGITLRESVGDKEIRVVEWIFGAPELTPAGTVAGNPCETRASVAGAEIQFVGKTTLMSGPAEVRETWSLDSTGAFLKVARVIEPAPGISLTNEETFERRR